MPAVIFSHGFDGSYQGSERNLFLIGASQGAVVSAITGAKHSEKICGMVLIYPAFVMVEDAKRLFGSADKIPQRPGAGHDFSKTDAQQAMNWILEYL